jgi:aminobenzoyl-glutamate utilization protein B
MTGTSVDHHLVGAAWPTFFNKVIAEDQQKNIESVGMPKWSDADQTLAKALQKEIGAKVGGLKEKIEPLSEPVKNPTGGGSDDVGDIAWNVPMVYLLLPRQHSQSSRTQLAQCRGHGHAHRAQRFYGWRQSAGDDCSGFSAATQARPASMGLLQERQTKDIHYESFLAAEDKPMIEMNKEKMDKFVPQLKKFYYDPTRFKTYLEQLGVQYPTVKSAALTHTPLNPSNRGSQAALNSVSDYAERDRFQANGGSSRLAARRRYAAACAAARSLPCSMSSTVSEGATQTLPVTL